MARINGTNGDNTILGTQRDDDIRVREGDDTAEAGDDTLFGGGAEVSFNDYLNGD